MIQVISNDEMRMQLIVDHVLNPNNAFLDALLISWINYKLFHTWERWVGGHQLKKHHEY